MCRTCTSQKILQSEYWLPKDSLRYRRERALHSLGYKGEVKGNGLLRNYPSLVFTAQITCPVRAVLRSWERVPLRRAWSERRILRNAAKRSPWSLSGTQLCVLICSKRSPLRWGFCSLVEPSPHGKSSSLRLISAGQRSHRTRPRTPNCLCRWVVLFDIRGCFRASNLRLCASPTQEGLFFPSPLQHLHTSK